ncbi:MAG: hypothetical protein MUO40_07590, partial [Anaerolineaceae bacterium]|nr:hypothetical protein [Anaerolineaceae bacterium]
EVMKDLLSCEDKYNITIRIDETNGNISAKCPDGLWIHITATTDQTLVLKGFMPSTTEISLYTESGGWNLVGFPAAASNTSISNALLSLAGKYTLVYAWNAETQEWISYDPTAPAYANDLTTMDPGKGYWIKITEHATWNVPY